ncbi:hypothetical protein [Streptomyces leeuwenhoekii]|uniref:Uncharacterized protein n=1 Tax=Streptomyces leeuwenhoekii TaxID=1437453 RepID=A0A0F7VQ59_STRLW|nr:hypothetical protein [Streptomyces leeuwenhoekii]CQR59537.1 Hypothetical Protein sle_00750 [Streptomyces leeuwenhoekii]
MIGNLIRGPQQVKALARFPGPAATSGADHPSMSAGLVSLVVTGAGMTGLFLVPVACSRQLPDVIRRRAAERRAGAGPAGLDDA